MSKSKISVEKLQAIATMADGSKVGGGNPPHELRWAEAIYAALGTTHPDDRADPRTGRPAAPQELEDRAEWAETILKADTDLVMSPEELVVLRKHVAYTYPPVVLRRMSAIVEPIADNDK